MNNLTMHDPDLLHILIELFFAMRESEELPPTVPGLALAIGFNRTQDIVSTLKHWEDDDSQYPESSIHELLSALTRIEDHCLINGLRDRMPASLVKFTLGSYHNVKEPSVNQNQTANIIQIAFEAPEERMRIRDDFKDHVKKAISTPGKVFQLPQQHQQSYQIEIGG